MFLVFSQQRLCLPNRVELTIRYAACSAYPDRAETTANSTHVINVNINVLFTRILMHWVRAQTAHDQRELTFE